MEMSFLRIHLKENRRRIARGEAPRDMPFYIKEHKGPNRARRRMLEAQARQRGDTPHILGRRKPKGWRRKKRSKGKLARKASVRRRYGSS
jgi:hypothetical protein